MPTLRSFLPVAVAWWFPFVSYVYIACFVPRGASYVWLLSVAASGLTSPLADLVGAFYGVQFPAFMGLYVFVHV